MPLTADAQEIDTRHLGFAIGAHEECAVEEAVRMTETHGGSATVLAAGPPEADEQLRYALAMGVHHGVHVETGPGELDAEATSAAIVQGINTIIEGGKSFDLILFGHSSADASHSQVGIRTAYELGLPIVSGVKGIEIGDGEVRLQREAAEGVESYQVPLPVAAAVKEGLNLPRYPTMPGRLRARKARLQSVAADPAPGGLRKIRLRQPAEKDTETVLLGHGAAAAPAVADMLAKLGVV